MTGKIIIIHNSEVIRKGFQAVLRGFCQREIVLLANTDTLTSFPPLNQTPLIYLVQSKYASKLQAANLLIIEEEDPVVPQANQISIYTSPTVLKEKIEALDAHNLTTTDKRPDQENLTEREVEVLRLVAYGHSNKEIADKLFISIHTVISHRKNITDKLSIKSISGLTVYAILNNLIDTDNINSSSLI